MSGVSRIRAHAGWELRLLLRNGEQILLMFVIPIALLFALRIMRGGEVDEQVPTVLTVSLIATCFTSLAIGTGFERRAGALKFLATTPLSRLDLLFGKSLATGALAALSLAALAIAAAGAARSYGGTRTDGAGFRLLLGPRGCLGAQGLGCLWFAFGLQWFNRLCRSGLGF